LLTKSQRKRIRQLAAEAYARELAAALSALHDEFERWKRDEISVFELSDRVHRFHNGVSRELYNRYATNMFHVGVMYALTHEL
jgi:hypothetical protein